MQGVHINKWTMFAMMEGIPTRLCIQTSSVMAPFLHSAAALQFTQSDYSNSEGARRVTTSVQLLTKIATPLTVELVPVNYTYVNNTHKPLPLSFPRIAEYNRRRPITANSKYTVLISIPNI